MPQHPPDTRQLADLDRAHVWHPFTPMRQWREAEPLIIERAEGCHLFDHEGRAYIDGVSSLWCNVHGHRVPSIDRAVRDQLEKVAHTTLLGLSSPPSIELAARLCRLSPGGLNKVFYTDSGATAVEVALKMAVGYWHHEDQPLKTDFIAVGGAYHGDTTGAMSVGYSDFFHHPFASMVFAVTHLAALNACRPPPDLDIRGPQESSDATIWPSENAELGAAIRDHTLDELKSILEDRADRIAAIVVEPLMQGAAGMVCHPPGFLRRVRVLADEHHVLLIADEVATGFGRTGTLFACEQEGVAPDIMCLAKGLTGGYVPLAATLATDAVEQAFCGPVEAGRTLYHGHTYTGNALACAAALASLDLFEATELLAHVRRSAAIIAERLDAMRNAALFPQVLDVRQRGLMVGIELCRDRSTGESFDPALRTGAAVCRSMRREGVILRPLGDVVVLMPIPAMPHDLLDGMLDVVLKALRTMAPA